VPPPESPARRPSERDADDGHPSQLPSSRNRTAPALGVDGRAAPRHRRARQQRPHLSQSLLDPASEGSGCRPWTSRRLATRSSPTKPRAARGRALAPALRREPAPRRRARRRGGAAPRRSNVRGSAVACSSSSNCSIRSPWPEGFACRHRATRLSRPIRDWPPGSASAASSDTLPLPRYMWTPQGRHGSKLRTVLMMSMPLKCSRSFSSKMGVSMTASS
jgi:hypothetical protein